MAFNFFTDQFFRILKVCELSWLSAAANFDNEEQELGKSLENESVYMGKKLTTNTAVPGRLCRDRRFADFYREVLNADEKLLKSLQVDTKCHLIKNLCQHLQKNNKSCLRNL